jgi:hypothetical protein
MRFFVPWWGATRLGKTEAGSKMAVGRLRNEYGQVLKDKIARPICSATEAEHEGRALSAILGP